MKRLLILLAMILIPALSFGGTMNTYYLITPGTCHTITAGQEYITAAIPLNYIDGFVGYNFTAISTQNNVADKFTQSNTLFGYQQANVNSSAMFTGTTDSWLSTDNGMDVTKVMQITSTSVSSCSFDAQKNSISPAPESYIRFYFKNNATGAESMSICTFVVTTN